MQQFDIARVFSRAWEEYVRGIAAYLLTMLAGLAVMLVLLLIGVLGAVVTFGGFSGSGSDLAQSISASPGLAIAGFVFMAVIAITSPDQLRPRTSPLTPDETRKQVAALATIFTKLGYARDDGTLKVRLTAAPVDGAANKKLIAFLSEEWGVAQSKLRIVRGEKSRNKLVEIDG